MDDALRTSEPPYHRSDPPIIRLLEWVTDTIAPRDLELEADPVLLEEPNRPWGGGSAQPARCPHNLNEFRYPYFVGRKPAIAEVLEALRETRLVTLVGTGGVGKTSVAVEIADRLVFGDQAEPEGLRFPGGIWMVTLEDLDRNSSRSEHVLWQRLAAQLDLENPDAGVGSTVDLAARLEEAVHAFLRGKRVLLILDNCEHLNRKALSGFISTLCSLSDCDVRLLVTSRVPLRIERYERVVDLDVLAAPPPGAAPTALWQNEAVELFVSRAERSSVKLARDEAGSDARVCCIARICRQVDFLPLAIVLVASRTPRYATLEELEADLDRILEEDRGEDDRERQRTLEKTIAWSYDLLERKELKQLFIQLAAFRGEFTPGDVAAVCPAAKNDEAQAKRLLQELHEARLLVRRREQSVYRFLETIFRFAGKRFQRHRQREATEQAHTAHFLGLFKGSLTALVSDEGSAGETFLTIHEPNVMLALERVADEPGLLGEAVLRSLEQSLPDPSVPRNLPLFRRLYPFAVASRALAAALEEQGVSPAAAPETQWLKKLHRGLEIQELFAGEGNWDALFGGKEPSFKTLRESLENRHWQDEALCTVAVLANMRDLNQAQVMFACMYFIAFDWWDAYYKPDSKCEYLLDAWAQHHPHDSLEKVLRAFSRTYPPSSDWERRSSRRKEWEEAAECLHEAQRLLRIDVPVKELKTRVQGYLRGITNRYLAECLHYTALGEPSLPQKLLRQMTSLFRAPARARGGAAEAATAPGPRKLFEQAQYLFLRDKDPFNYQWVTWQLADALQENRDFEAALEQCKKAIDSEWEELGAEDELTRDTIDLEVLSNLYRVLGDVLTGEGKHEEALLHHACAHFMAFAFLYTENDAYAVALYRETFERLLAALAALVDGKVGEREAFLASARRIEALWRPGREAGEPTDFAREAMQVGWRHRMHHRPESLAPLLLPPLPEGVEDIEPEGDYCARIGAMIEAMPEHLTALESGVLGGCELPYRFRDFCVMLAEAPDEIASAAEA